MYLAVVIEKYGHRILVFAKCVFATRFQQGTGTLHAGIRNLHLSTRKTEGGLFLIV